MAFETTTTAFAGIAPVRKPFTWTYSDLKNYRDCPKRHFHYKMAKNLGMLDQAIRESDSAQLQHGNEAHAALANRVSKNTTLPIAFLPYEGYAKAFCDTAAKFPGSKIVVEQKLALTREYNPCGYFDKAVWFRAVADAVILMPNEGMALNWDWKTGKVKNDPLQVLLSSAVLFYQYPWLQGTRNELVWVEHGQKTTAYLTRADLPSLWAAVLPEVQKMEEAFNLVNYPPKPNFLCKEWCDVEACPHHGG